MVRILVLPLFPDRAGLHISAPDRWRSIEATMDLEVLMRPLKPRTRAIFRQRMNGETMANIARSFGFSECRGNQLVAEAMKLMSGAVTAS
jgi:hypothetical protein